MKHEGLLACPSCGGDSRLKGYKKYVVICKSCGFSTAKHSTATDAVTSWNKRTLTRCKDCKNYHADTGWCMVHSRYLSTGDEYVMFMETDYCSDAKPKTGGETDGADT